MTHLMALLCLVSRAVRPSRGLHAAPFVLRRELREEARARRARRVRRYAERVPAATGAQPSANPVPLVPAPRGPVDDGLAAGLHACLRRGGEPPRGWCPGRTTRRQEYTTSWFDTLSEILRDPNARPTLRRTVNAAETAWLALDAALRDGAAMPEPWHGRRRA